MANSWKVETEQLKSASNVLTDLIGKYNTQYEKLYQEVDNLKSQNWTGVASEAFNSKLESYKNDFQELEKVLKSFCEFLNSAAERYDATEDAIKDAAGNLNAGA